MAPKSDDAERSCIVTRAAQPPEGLIRFVAGPDGKVVPDIRGKLPGRGVWVSGRREIVAEAVRKQLFARGLKAEAKADADLPDLVERLLVDAALSSLRAETPDATAASAALAGVQQAMADPGADSTGGPVEVEGILVTDATGHPLPCEAMLSSIRDQRAGGAAVADAAALEDLVAKAT